MKIAFLYTLEANKTLFRPYIDQYLADKSVTISHHVNEQLLKQAIVDGLTSNVVNLVQQEIHEIAIAGADIIICTCSTIGDAAEQTANITARVIRVDRPMAEQAVLNNSIHVLAALESTIEPTIELLQQCAKQLNQSPNIACTVIPDAWQYYANGDTAAYARAIAKATVQHVEQNSLSCDTIVLAQASMAPALEYIHQTSIAVLSSPALCCQYLSKQVPSNRYPLYRD
ncbi:hypothetical protein RJ45_15180 [Photobacterium gaetbulicola]|uniref:Arylsulfatase n=1 Tax=Photobacterium gaetbulicola TaxID=1295392 RepID=A0A0B9H1Z6_9GAMM|nr:hypothetical protein [Photobacterium gaetbulicola]KHT62837.1 hypothetical protein RJ45_15180 [Photobacterium gaetbulicola]